MTCEEFSNQFDVEINAYYTQLPFGLSQDALTFNEYEKSVFLTEAQNDLVINLYNGNNTIFKESYEETEQLRKYLNALVKTHTVSSLTETTTNNIKNTGGNYGGSSHTYNISFPQNSLYIVWEEASASIGSKTKHIDVIPVEHDEFHRINRNPFRQANKWRALRLDNGANQIELSSKYVLNSYSARYLEKPTPIILVDLGDLTIEGLHTKTECSLNSVLHPYILSLAIQRALASRSLTNKS